MTGTSKLKDGERYWTYYRDKVFETVWRNDMVDNDREYEGRIFKTKKEADKAFKEKTL